MFNVRPRGTVTEVITLQEQHARGTSQAPVAAHDLPMGPGVALGASAAMSPAKPLSLQAEHTVHTRLENMLAERRMQRIHTLVTQMLQAPLPPELLHEVEAGAALFDSINPHQQEDQALILGALVFRVIRPAITKSSVPPEQVQFLQWEDRCREILRQMLPKSTPVELFLRQCEGALREESLFHKRCDRIAFAAEVETQALDLANQSLDRQMDEANESIKERLTALQAARHAMDQRAVSEGNALLQEANQVQTQALNQALAIQALAKQDSTNQQQLNADCEVVLRRLL
jgi:hypothetical protein